MARKHLCVSDLLEWAGLPFLEIDRSTAITGVTMSSRIDGDPPMRVGALFVAVRGGTRDGHQFVADALANGAVGAIVEHVPASLKPAIASGRLEVLHPSSFSVAGEREIDNREGLLPPSGTRQRIPFLLLVPVAPKNFVDSASVSSQSDPAALAAHAYHGSLGALQSFGRWWRLRWGRPVIAVAGSLGKTTTKDLTVAATRQRYAVLGTRGNFNNELGLPITLLGLTSDHDLAVVEIGISAIGEMAHFAGIADATIGVMTRIEVEHLEYFEDVDTVEREEGAVIAQLPSSGVAVLNRDDPRVWRMANRTTARILSYGEDPDADVRATDIVDVGLGGSSFSLHAGGRKVSVTLPLIGRHFVSCALGASAAAYAAGCSIEEIARGLSDTPLSPRIRAVQANPHLLILDDTYNASPASCRAALDLLSAIPLRNGEFDDRPRVRIAVLGDMFELGHASEKAHQEIGAYVPRCTDVFIATGKASVATATAARAAGMDPERIVSVETAADVAAVVHNYWQCRGDFPRLIVLVKGSRGMQMEIAVRSLQELDWSIG